MARKSKNPRGFVLGNDTYLRLDTVLELIDAAGTRSIKEYEKQAKEALQISLDNGENINIRNYKRLKKEAVHNLGQLLKSIKFTVQSVEPEF